MTDLDRPALPRFGLSAATLLTIFAGGALGTVARYLVDTAHPTARGHFPVATLVINLSGSLAIGMLIPLISRQAERLPQLRPFVIIGLLGGWTTYSTLAVDAEQLAQHGHLATMLASLAATVVGGVVAVIIGRAAAQHVLPPEAAP